MDAVRGNGVGSGAVGETACHLARLLSPGRVDGEVLQSLLAGVRAHGVRQLAGAPVRLAARRALSTFDTVEVASTTERDAIRWLLTRLAQAGAMPASYAQYIGGDVTRAHLLASGDPHVVLTDVARWCYDAFEFLGSPDVLECFDVERREAVAHAAAGIEEIARATAFATRRAASDVEYELLARVLLVPESPFAEELLFLRVLQAMELVFECVGMFLDASRRSFSHGDVSSANHAVHGALIATDLLPPLMRSVRVMPVEAWRSVRPYILDPAAVQGAGYPSMMLALETSVRVEALLTRVGDQNGLTALPRIAERDHALLECYKTLLGLVETELRKWRSWHGRAAATYNGAPNEWLANRSHDAQHIRDAS
jgi:hypothetical protein